MASNIYASFADADQAEKAAGALLDYGVPKDDISVVSNRDNTQFDEDHDEAEELDHAAKQGISTTTPRDAGAGAAKGAGIGLAAGVIAGLASIFVPGIGLVYGAGALATAIGGAVGATAAGAVAGGVTGYLKDQGVNDDVVNAYASDLNKGGALLEVSLASGKVDQGTASEIITKYGGNNTNVY